MSTLEFVSASADGIAESAAPLVTAPVLVAGLGTHPALTVPLVCGREADADHIWRLLDETARFYGVDIPPVGALGVTLQSFLAETAARHGIVALAARVLVVEVHGRMQFVVSGSVIEPNRPDPVALAGTPERDPGPLPYWRRMAARTTSAADTDLTERDLRAAGYADEVSVAGGVVGQPRLGALIVETAEGTVGVGEERLTLLRSAGLADVPSVSDRPVAISGATRAWWVSPRFETHPVSAVGATRFEVQHG